MNHLERDLRQMYARREADLREPRFAPAHAPAPVLRRTRRHQAGVVITAIAVVAAVAIGSTAGALSLLRSSDRLTPADQSETPTPPPGEPVRPADLGVRFDVAAAWGEVDGVAWAIWANDELSCLAFTSANGGGDGACGNVYDGSDLRVAGTCVYGCPVPQRSVLYGTVSSRVATLQLDVDDGSTHAGTIYPPPVGVTVDARAFTVPVDRPWGTFTGMLTATDADGTVLERIRYPGDADAAGGVSMPATVEATLASGVPTSAVDGRPAESERWEIAVWRNASDDWCLGTVYPYVGTVYPYVGTATIATEGSGCGPREELFSGIRTGAIGHADVWWIDESSMFGENARWFRYRAVGTVSSDAASVRIELADGQVVDAELVEPPVGLEDMGRLFVAEFRSKLHPWAFEGTGGISWRALALDANGEVLGSDEINL